MKEFTSKNLWDGRLIVISVQKMRGQKRLAPCLLIRKRDGMLLYGSYHYDNHHRRTAKFRPPTICFTAIEAVEEGDTIGIINHKGNLETYVVKDGQLVPQPSASLNPLVGGRRNNRMTPRGGASNDEVVPSDEVSNDRIQQ